ncbi:MAG TPA: type II toxin-antitoxin system RelE/ParE family toxin [Stellaceae bacterium]|nr:type II toxin-antitoxin system RelE/ParE family toxin [Stellaceae bacterium]
MAAIEFSPRALFDLEEITDYIARDNPKRAGSFAEELKAHCFRIAENPEAYAYRRDLSRGLRMAVHGRYLIYFRSGTSGVRIVRILHSARRTPGSM